MKTAVNTIGEQYASKMEQIVSILNGPELERSWKECITAWEDSSPAQRADCRAFVVNLRDNFVRVLRDVDDPEEQETIAAIFYTQVKAQWILINTQSGYQLRSGRMDGLLFCRAGMLSALLGAMEPVLREVDLTRITNFLAEPNANLQAGSEDTGKLSELLKGEVLAAEPMADGSASGLVIVEATALENRLRDLLMQIENDKREWRELQADLGVSERAEIVALFEKLQYSTATETMSDDGGDKAIAQAARAEWVERRELQLRSLRKEMAILRADFEQVQSEIGATDVASLITNWREARKTLTSLRNEIAHEKVTLSAVRSEYGNEVTGAQIIEELRRLSSELAETQVRYNTLRTESEYLEREFGTFNAQQMVTLIRNLRDKITELSALQITEGANRAALSEEFGTADAGAIIGQVRDVRDSLATLTREMVTLRADRYVFQQELGKTDAREIVTQFRALEKEIESFREMSELLGTMETALKTLNA